MLYKPNVWAQEGLLESATGLGTRGARRDTLAHADLLSHQALVVHCLFSTLISLLGSHGVLCNDHKSWFPKAHLDCSALGTSLSRQRVLGAERREFSGTRGIKMWFLGMPSHKPDPTALISRVTCCITLGKMDSCQSKGKVEIYESFNPPV